MARRGKALWASLLALALLPAAAAWAASDPEALDGRFASTTVLRNDAAHPLFRGTTVEVGFHRSGDRVGLSWTAKCNSFGGRVEISDHRLSVTDVVGTTMYCTDRRLRRQDAWLGRFFASEPRWETRGPRRLRLTSGGRVLKLSRAA